MTEIEQKALALVNEVVWERGHGQWERLSRETEALSEAICRAIEQHEAFKREVSKAITDLTYQQHQYTFARGAILGHLEKFVLKEPVDPLVEALKYMGTHPSVMFDQQMADEFRAALAKRGLEVREIEG